MSVKCKATNRNGEPCQNQTIDTTGYCRIHHPQVSQHPSTGSEFEEQVLKVLRLLGYKVERNVNINGCQIDVYGEYRTGVITLKLVVECKDYGDGKTVGIEEINKFAGVLAVARNTGAVDKGLFVTTNGYTQAAKVNARPAGIELTTYRELSTQLVDFDDYLDGIIAEYQASPVSKYYIDLSGTEVEDYEGADESVFQRPFDSLVNQRLFKDGHNKLALLGNFGTGKTTFCRKYAHDLAILYKNNQTTRIPIIVNLSDYDSKLHIQQLVLNTLQFRYNINITQTLCLELQRIGRFLLLFDGFDEMAVRVDPYTIRENLYEINKISEIAENKFILTCRTHFFRDRVQVETLADFDIFYIPEWGECELKEYLQKRFGSQWKKHLERISGTHNLPELAQTPLFLEMIVETLPNLGDEVRRVELYQVYTNNWIQDQSRRKGARLSADQRRQFVKELAMKLYLEGILSCHHREFIPLLQQRFDIDDAAQMDYLRSDVQTCTFLTRDPEGNYGFRHKSFMEFFVAQTLFDEIKSESDEHLKFKLLPLEIRGFLADYLASAPPANLLKEWFQNSKEQVFRDNILSLLSRLRISISDTKFDDEPEKELETKIIARFLQGDLSAFDILYRMYRSQLVIYLRSKTQRSDLVEDIVSEAFLRVWKNRDRLERIGGLQAYLRSIANNLYIDALRRERVLRGTISLDTPIDDLNDSLTLNDILGEDSPESAILQQQTLTNALQFLSEKERLVIVGIFSEGKAIKALAHEIGQTPNSVRIIQHRALKKLQKLLKDDKKTE